jgi:GTP-binding protein YchF
MKSGIIGLLRSGKSTVFDALTKNVSDETHTKESRIGTIFVPDHRIDDLSKMYQPKKTIYAQVEYFLPGAMHSKKDQSKEQDIWTQVRDCDALIHVIRNFGGYGFEGPTPYDDFTKLDQELIFADLVVIEKRLERLELDKKRGKDINQEELSLLNQCHEILEAEIPLRKNPDLASAHVLKGYAFVSGKPMLVLFNNEDDDDKLPDSSGFDFKENCMVIRGKLEQELAQMSAEEASEFLAEFNITESAMDRVIKRSYELLGLVSFFTVGDDEVRAWTIKAKTQAIDAAGAVHTDMKQGFIRAEVLSYENLMAAGTFQEAKKKGTVKLEGKTYQVQDGDIINFRFNV